MLLKGHQLCAKLEAPIRDRHLYVTDTFVADVGHPEPPTGVSGERAAKLSART